MGMKNIEQYYSLLIFTYVYKYALVPYFMIFFIQSLKSQFSRLAGVITADLEKAKQLLNSVDEDIPLQIQQDLASTYLDLEPNFTAVTQMSAEMSNSLTQAMETGKVSVHC